MTTGAVERDVGGPDRNVEVGGVTTDTPADESRSLQPAMAGTYLVEAAVDSSVVVPGVIASVAGAPDAIPANDVQPPDVEPTSFGIAEAIRLMRSLPSGHGEEDLDLVTRVVHVTLAAVDVSVEEIMEDARKKEKSINDRVAVLQNELGELEKTLYARRCEIAARQADLDETVKVREHLYTADQHTRHRPPPIPPAALRIPGSRFARTGQSAK